MLAVTYAECHYAYSRGATKRQSQFHLNSFSRIFYGVKEDLILFLSLI
jgi:hypothetical protein